MDGWIGTVYREIKTGRERENETQHLTSTV